MSDSRQTGEGRFSALDADDELLRADALLGKVDALLKRHKPAEEDGGSSPMYGRDNDDLPILTDVVDDFAPPSDGFSRHQPASSENTFVSHSPVSAESSSSADMAFARLAEMLIQIDTDVARDIEVWLTRELPQIIERELASLSERIRVEALAQLRSTLLPTLSEHISSRLDKLDR